MKKENAYTKLADGFTQIGQAFNDINEDTENPPSVKIIVMQIANKMNLGDAELTELIGFLQYCTANDDLDMKKLTKELSTGAAEEEAKETLETKELSTGAAEEEAKETLETKPDTTEE